MVREPEGAGPAPGFSEGIGLGAAIGVCVGVGVFLGVLADGHWGTSPLFAIVGLVIGILLAVGVAYVEMRRYF